MAQRSDCGFTRAPAVEAKRCYRIAAAFIIAWMGCFCLLGKEPSRPAARDLVNKVHATLGAFPHSRSWDTDARYLAEEEAAEEPEASEGEAAEVVTDAEEAEAPKDEAAEESKDTEGEEPAEGEESEEPAEGEEGEGGEGWQDVSEGRGEGEGGEGEGEEGGEGEGEGEEEGQEKVDMSVEDVVFLLAVSVVTFFGVDLGLLYVMKYRDHDIRSYAYRMISSTLSIFMAVMINAAIFSFITEQLVTAPPPRGLGLHLEGRAEMLMNFVVGLIIYILFLLALSVAGWKCKGNEEAIYTCNTIGGHLTGFAGIAFYGNWQKLCDSGGFFQHHHYAFFSMACMCSLVVLTLTTLFRGQLKKCDQGRQEASEDEEEGDWVEEVEEAEDDATALIFSFLASQLVVWWRTGSMPDMEPDFKHLPKQADVVWMFFPVLASMFALALLTHVKKKCPDFESMGRDARDAGGHHFMKMARRIVDALQTFCAMTMSWCALRMGQWQLQIIFSSSRLGLPSMVGILNAIFLTGLSCTMIFCLDKVADLVGDLHSDEAVGEYSPVPGDQSRSQEAEEAERVKRDHIQRWVAALRKIIDSFGLLIGLCWERAADAAIEVIVEDAEALRERPVMAKTMAAVIVSVMIFPAWIKYIVPVAKKTSLEHSLSLALERIHTSHMSKRRTKAEKTKIEELQQMIVTKCEWLKEDDDVIVVTVPVLMKNIDKFHEEVKIGLQDITDKRK
eukprot:CAMPEP_0178468552 /NCGR_PEP_ID=MMETSP0689_2-20121128/52976_1 /TAXON_ID=160604 /ORGANISM="Amphidinium massartii, Strain CS-259" /LENGTH=727 /DNA_ID=CAMNT_0020095607 /DNA_START=8 /DNA_END=2191 /DNA_ORIENTATION=-